MNSKNLRSCFKTVFLKKTLHYVGERKERKERNKSRRVIYKLTMARLTIIKKSE